MITGRPALLRRLAWASISGGNIVPSFCLGSSPDNEGTNGRWRNGEKDVREELVFAAVGHREADRRAARLRHASPGSHAARLVAAATRHQRRVSCWAAGVPGVCIVVASAATGWDPRRLAGRMR